MNATTKNSLKSALVLIILAVVAVVALALANALMPKYEPKLDIEKVRELTKLLPSDVDAQTALDEGYFSMDTETDIAGFNKSSGSGDAVLAVYKVDKGEYAGSIVIETRSTGFHPGIIMLTSVKDGIINGLGLIASSEDPDADDDIFATANFEKLKAAVIGQSAVTQSLVQTSTGSTASASAMGAANNITLSIKMYNHIKGGA